MYIYIHTISKIMLYFYNRNDSKHEPIMKINFTKSRLNAAKYFAEVKKMSLKTFLKLFGVSKQN